MRRTAFISLAAVLAAGCSDYLSPSTPGTMYALARIGPTPVPVFIGPDGTFPLLLADTLQLFQVRPHADQTILRHATVVRLEDSRVTRAEAQYYYQIENGRLTFDQCPVGYFCAAVALIGSPRVFDVVGDSLFEVLPANALGLPYVYGRVWYR